MGVRFEVTHWERQPREGHEAYTAFLAYRDLGPRRTLEATRLCLGKRPGYLKPIERWSSLREWRLRAAAWDDHLQAERDKVTAAETAKWERRRLQALEQNWELCQALRARIALMIAIPPEAPEVTPPAPTPAMPEAIPDAAATPEEASKSARCGPSRWDYRAVTGLSKLVFELEQAVLAEALPGPEDFDPMTATMEEFKEYMARYYRRPRPPR